MRPCRTTFTPRSPQLLLFFPCYPPLAACYSPTVRPYLDLLSDVLEHGESRADRTGTGPLAVFGRQVRYDLTRGFPCLTTKKLHLRSIIHELLWFLRGDTNVRYLQQNDVSIWDDWADENGDLGPVYGRQWRSFPSPDGRSIDQIGEIVHGLRGDPSSRRHLVVAWNPGELNRMALPPCHCLFQFFVHQPDSATPGLSCQLYQRSADLFLGVPFNIASYALLTCMLAGLCGYQPREFIHTFGDLHLYQNHLDQARTQLAREPRPLPTMWINPQRTEIDQFVFDDFRLDDYNPHPHIKADVSV